MAQKCECLCCGHPILKKLIEFYCLIWGVIGLLFLFGMIWGMVQYKNLSTKGFWKMGGPWTTQEQGITPRGNLR